jgi:hypothetical protein
LRWPSLEDLSRFGQPCNTGKTGSSISHGESVSSPRGTVVIGLALAVVIVLVLAVEATLKVGSFAD